MQRPCLGVLDVTVEPGNVAIDEYTQSALTLMARCGNLHNAPRTHNDELHEDDAVVCDVKAEFVVFNGRCADENDLKAAGRYGEAERHWQR